MITRLLSKILGDPNEKEIRRCRKIVEHIKVYEKKYEAFDEAEIQNKTAAFKERLSSGSSLDEILPEVFALVKTACKRLVGKTYSVRDGAFKDFISITPKSIVATEFSDTSSGFSLFLSVLVERKGVIPIYPTNFIPVGFHQFLHYRMK